MKNLTAQEILSAAHSVTVVFGYSTNVSTYGKLQQAGPFHFEIGGNTVPRSFDDTDREYVVSVLKGCRRRVLWDTRPTGMHGQVAVEYDLRIVL